MKERMVTVEALDKLVAAWAKRGAVYAPAKVKGKDWTEFSMIGSLRDADFSRVNTKQPAKGLLFPQREAILRFKDGQSEEPDAPEEQVVLGIRPCDAAAIAFQAKFFAGQGQTDPYFKARLEKTTLVGIACNSPADTCFCTAVGGSPSGTRGLDLLLTDIGGKYVAEPVTDKGAELVADMPEPAAEDLGKRRELSAKAAEKMQAAVDTKALKALLDDGFEHPAWETLNLPCVNCGACTFLCPTCHCFDVTDEMRKGQGGRFRVWDSCQFAIYSQHASGHNPRQTARSRYRNRVMDKFKYTVDMVGEVSCVGCGRCVVECPAGIDIRETVATLQAALAERV
jgi:sulfhydrogenase subunit beta (sulfur reductase)